MAPSHCPQESSTPGLCVEPDLHATRPTDVTPPRHLPRSTAHRRHRGPVDAGRIRHIPANLPLAVARHSQPPATRSRTTIAAPPRRHPQVAAHRHHRNSPRPREGTPGTPARPAAAAPRPRHARAPPPPDPDAGRQVDGGRPPRRPACPPTEGGEEQHHHRARGHRPGLPAPARHSRRQMRCRAARSSPARGRHRPPKKKRSPAAACSM